MSAVNPYWSIQYLLEYRNWQLDGKPYKNISFMEDAKVFVVDAKNDVIKESVKKMHSLTKK